MSEFVKKREQISRGNDQPIGFGQRARFKSAPMILVALLDQYDSDLVGQAISGGSDALLFDIRNPIDQLASISKLSGLMGKTPWGVRLKAGDIEDIESLSAAGCDYIVVNYELPAQLLHDEKIGKVLEVDSYWEDGLAEAIEVIQVDALLITGKGKSDHLSIKQLMNYGRLLALADKPALVPLPENRADLELLFEAGVSGVIVEVGSKEAEGKLAEIKDNIQNLSSSKKKKGEFSHAMLPKIGASSKEGGKDLFIVKTDERGPKV
ncbi:MAG: hypothetical protein HOC20_06600 [Chloroflexi bacterium]|nr:hypothetical protein [Chloroflexota bacterium]